MRHSTRRACSPGVFIENQDIATAGSLGLMNPSSIHFDHTEDLAIETKGIPRATDRERDMSEAMCSYHDYLRGVGGTTCAATDALLGEARRDGSRLRNGAGTAWLAFCRAKRPQLIGKSDAC